MADPFDTVASAIIAPIAALQRALRAIARAAVALVLAAALIAGGERAAAQEISQFGNWFVVELRGSAHSRPVESGDGPWWPLAAGQPLMAGTVVRTGGDGNLLLANRVDRIRLSPNSELELPVSEDDAVTRVIHWIGTALFDVGKRPSPQFQVDTSYLVAVVKGTAFATTVSEAGSVIKVTQGTVGVTPARGGATVDVTAGETASVAAGDSGTVSPGDLSGASSQGGLAAGSSAAAAASGDTTVESDTAAGAGAMARSGHAGPGGGNSDRGAKGSYVVRGFGNGTGGDDGNNGHGNDGDHDDDGNPGQGGGGRR